MRNLQEQKIPLFEGPYTYPLKRSLFEDGYLEPENNSGLRSLPGWRSPKEVEDAFDEVAGILTKFQRNYVGRRGPGETTTETKCVDRLLAALGWNTKLGIGLPERDEKADFALFADEGEMQRVKDEAGSPRYWHDVTAICEGKKWGLGLEHDACREDSPPSLNRRPVHQIMCYLHWAQVEWGILTNGVKWRLYHRKDSLPPTAQQKDVIGAIQSAAGFEFPTYEVDLASLVERKDRDHFDYFVNFFAPTAYLHNPTSNARLLDLVLRGSEEWKKQEQREERKAQRRRKRAAAEVAEASEGARATAYEAARELTRCLQKNKLIVRTEHGVRKVLEAAYSADVVNCVLEDMDDCSGE